MSARNALNLHFITQSVFSQKMLIVLMLAIIFYSLNINTTLAQSNSCSALKSTIRSLERNRDFRALNKNIANLRNIQKETKKAESQFVRTGCQKILNARKKLTRQCRTIAKDIIRGRSNVKKLKVKVGTGQAIARQRESLLQKIASNSCAKPKAPTRNNNSNRNNNKNLFEILFGPSNKNEIITTEVPNIQMGLNTLRSLCVRLSDGYYWPISFSTTEQYLGQDLTSCKKQSNGYDVDLYYHKNPGQNENDMVNMSGRPYKSLPNAFLYRREFIASKIFKQQRSTGFFEVVENNYGERITMVSLNEKNFPMPKRDPRVIIKTTIIKPATVKKAVVKIVSVPIPIARPYREGEKKPEVKTIAAPIKIEPIRTFISNGKTIRIIGPDTLYAQSTPTGS